MIDKFWPDMGAAVADMPDGASVMIGGFGSSGIPLALIDAVCAAGPRHLGRERGGGPRGGPRARPLLEVPEAGPVPVHLRLRAHTAAEDKGGGKGE